MLSFIPLLLYKVTQVQQQPRDRQFLKRLKALIPEIISNNTFDISRMSKEMCVSPTHLRRRMRALTGYSPSHYIRCKRLQEAARLIRHERLSVSEAAYQAGFNNMSYFPKCFKEEFGIFPSKY